MRAANYFVPAANDGAPAEVVVFQGIGGSPQANIMRWQGQVRGADGQPVEAETSSLEVAGVPVTMVELQGQYVGMGQQPPQDDQIFLGAVIEAPSGDLHVRFVGDQTTVEANRDDFMAMIQGLQRKETNAGGNAAAPPTNPDDSAAEVTIEDDWFFRVRGIERLRQMEGNKAPDLMVKDWVGQPRSLADLRGKVVVVDFWGTWCPPCMMAIPKNVELVEKYGDDGLVMLGVHDFSKGTEKIPQVVERMNINYPVATDDGGASQRAWRVSFWPTYFVIDQQGIVRAAGIDPKFLENVITQLLPQAS
jgi:thiol-disulfide isomerase/thioredoxin